MVPRDTMYVNGRAVAKIDDVMASESNVIEPLRAALRDQADRVLVEASREDIVEREVTIMGDRTAPFRVLKRSLATCTDDDSGKVSLAVIAREGGGPGGAGAG